MLKLREHFMGKMLISLSHLASRFFSTPQLKAFSRFAAIFYSVLLFYIFFLAKRRRGPTLPWGKRHVNLIPAKNKFDYLVSQSNVPDPQLREFYIDLFGNILLFIPFAFFFYLLFRIKDSRKSILIAVIVSVFIEIIQFILSIGVADIDDVILNATGATMGVFILNFLIKVKVFKKSAYCI